MPSVAGFAGTSFAAHRAEKRNRFGFRLEIGERRFQCRRRRLHHRMMKWMIDAHETRERALRFELGRHRLE